MFWSADVLHLVKTGERGLADAASSSNIHREPARTRVIPKEKKRGPTQQPGKSLQGSGFTICGNAGSGWLPISCSYSADLRLSVRAFPM